MAAAVRHATIPITILSDGHAHAATALHDGSSSSFTVHALHGDDGAADVPANVPADVRSPLGRTSAALPSFALWRGISAAGPRSPSNTGTLAFPRISCLRGASPSVSSPIP